MAVLTRAEMVTLARQLALDNGTNLAVDATTAIALVNDAYFLLVELGPERVELKSATTLGTGSMANVQSSTITDTSVRDVLQVMAAGSTNATQGEMLERVEPWRIRQLYGSSTVNGTVKYWAVERDPTTTAADVGKLRLLAYPTQTSAWYPAAVCIIQPTLLSGDSDKPDVTDDESHAIARIAAMEIARLTGRPDSFIADIGKQLPQRIQASLQERGSFYKPTRTGPAVVRPS